MAITFNLLIGKERGGKKMNERKFNNFFLHRNIAIITL